MAKFETFVGLMVGLTMLFYISGLLEGTANSTLLNLLLDPTGWQNSSLTLKVLAIFSGVAAASIIVGFFSSANTKQVAVSAFTVFFMSLLWDFLSVVAKVYAVHEGFALLIFSPFIILYLISIINWWGFVSSG